MENSINIRECATLDEFAECVNLQREVFALPEVELSPVRHFIVTKNAGGFTLGAYDGGRLAGYVLSVPAFMRGERAFYSHMTGVRREYQSLGVGRQLKWAQRERAMAEGVNRIKWTFEPVKARNGYFNLEKLGAVVSEYERNFYGADYAVDARGKKIGLQSDRLFAEWHLDSEKVMTLAGGGSWEETRTLEAEIEIVNDWAELMENDPLAALDLQMRVRADFEAAIRRGLHAGGFLRDKNRPRYLLFGK